ncbi:DUF4937 domain-containing protein [uncultured Shewanella sp.]|uniref:DUF4937 domain-containing protein n=1 Tax=uncultured Shewanella sp. TaxID=173975 RepID=UPI00261BD1DA|nr:DUF4937 domain-containing protein [uncultured Shewanella sp.]
MMIKWIEVLPKTGKEQAFSTAQETWHETAQCSGFEGQLGGWCKIKNEQSEVDHITSQAMLLAFWRDMSAIDDFMATKHDDIADNNNQARTYESCTVHYLQSELRFGALLTSSIKEMDVNDIGFIRIADCSLKVDDTGLAEQTFFHDQTHVWDPAMQACDGMIGGAVARFIKQDNRFLVISFWQNKASHQTYMTDAFQTAKSQVNLSSYIDKLTGYQIVIEPNWSILNGYRFSDI